MNDISIQKVTSQIALTEWSEFERHLGPMETHAPHLGRAFQVLVHGKSTKEAAVKYRVTPVTIRNSLYKVYRRARAGLRRGDFDSIPIRRFVELWEGNDPAMHTEDPIPDKADTYPVTLLMSDMTDGMLLTLDIHIPKSASEEQLKDCVIRWGDNFWTFQERVSIGASQRGSYMVFQRRMVIDVDEQIKLREAAEGIANSMGGDGEGTDGMGEAGSDV